MKPTVFKQMVYKMLPISDAEKMEQHVLRQTCKPRLKRLYNTCRRRISAYSYLQVSKHKISN